MIDENDFSRANGDLDRIDEAHPDLLMTNHLRGLIALRDKQLDQAVGALRQVLSAVPESMQRSLLAGVIGGPNRFYEAAHRLPARLVENRFANTNLPLWLQQVGLTLEV